MAAVFEDLRDDVGEKGRHSAGFSDGLRICSCV